MTMEARMLKKTVFIIMAIMGCALFIPRLALAQTETPQALVITADTPVTPAMVDYVRRGIQTASQRGAELLIIELNTPGGSLDMMNLIVADIRASEVPVVVYVTPNGAMAGSAGTLITLAGHACAMAPNSAIGAASPVDALGQDLSQTEQAKVKNMMEALARSLAERRGAAAVTIAQQTIESAQAVSAQEAYQAGLIDFIAADTPDLLRKLDGFKVQTLNGERVLHTTNIKVQRLPISIMEQLLLLLTNPNLVFVLLLVGVQALLIELSSPGGWVAGFIGVVCLALAGYGMGILNVNWFGLIFMVTAFVLFILDIKTPTHGALTLAGTASLIVGALVLFNSPGTPRSLQVSPVFVVGVSILTAISFFIMISFAIRAQSIPIRTGPAKIDSLVGMTGVVRSDLTPHGTVQVNGELWSADPVQTDERLSKGALVKVVGVDGFKLRVQKQKETGS
jgi:membrane-bound serine protease (ClpP class)